MANDDTEPTKQGSSTPDSSEASSSSDASADIRKLLPSGLRESVFPGSTSDTPGATGVALIGSAAANTPPAEPTARRSEADAQAANSGTLFDEPPAGTHPAANLPREEASPAEAAQTPPQTPPADNSIVEPRDTPQVGNIPDYGSIVAALHLLNKQWEKHLEANATPAASETAAIIRLFLDTQPLVAHLQAHLNSLTAEQQTLEQSRQPQTSQTDQRRERTKRKRQLRRHLSQTQQLIGEFHGRMEVLHNRFQTQRLPNSPFAAPAPNTAANAPTPPPVAPPVGQTPPGQAPVGVPAAAPAAEAAQTPAAPAVGAAQAPAAPPPAAAPAASSARPTAPISTLGTITTLGITAVVLGAGVYYAAPLAVGILKSTGLPSASSALGSKSAAWVGTYTAVGAFMGILGALGINKLFNKIGALIKRVYNATIGRQRPAAVQAAPATS